MTQHEGLSERLRIEPTASQYLSLSDLIASLVEDRKNAADALESQSREIAALKEQLRISAQAVKWESDLAEQAMKDMEGLRKDAELWRWAITTGRDYRHNIFKAYDNWDGQDNFEDAAIAAKGGSDG